MVAWQTPSVDKLILSADGVDIWFVDLNRSDQVVGRCHQILSPDERERAQRFHFSRDQRRYVVCRGALRFILTAYLKIALPHTWRFEYAEWGKPALIGSDLAFNVSHSEDVALVAVAQNGALGVDIERVREMIDMADVVETVFSIHEQRAWRGYAAVNRPAAFFAGWTRKEAVVKGVGQGLSIPLKSFAVDLTPDVARPQSSLSEWHIRSFIPQPQFMGAVVSDRPIKQLNYFLFDFLTMMS